MNIGAPWPDLDEAESRVLAMQTKLHQWAMADPGRRFDDVFNLVYDPAFLVVAWRRVRGNRGARSAGIDGIAPRSIVFGAGEFLTGLRDDLKARRFCPVPVRERMIPKAGGKLRRLGIPTVADRVVQASLKLVLEPIFEADFHPCSYGFRPRRRAQDAIAEIHYLASPPRNYEWSTARWTRTTSCGSKSTSTVDRSHGDRFSPTHTAAVRQLRQSADMDDPRPAATQRVVFIHGPCSAASSWTKVNARRPFDHWYEPDLYGVNATRW